MTTRVFYEYAGIVQCGTEMPTIEPRRDRKLVNLRCACYNCLCVLPTPTELGEAEFRDPSLLSLERVPQKLPRGGDEVMLPLLSGPFGAYRFKLLEKQNNQFHCTEGAGDTSRKCPSAVAMC